MIEKATKNVLFAIARIALNMILRFDLEDMVLYELVLSSNTRGQHLPSR